jgi:enoyl-CoA hydratase
MSEQQADSTKRDYENIRYQASPPLALILIDREPADNILNISTINELKSAFGQAQQDNSVRAAIITGSGARSFCAGLDLSELTRLDPPAAKHYAEQGQALLNQIEQLGKPVIAAINGLALGAGLELALACSLRIAADHAKLGEPAAKMGLMPGFGGAQRLARLIGRGRAMELLLTADAVDAEEAYRLGLVNRVIAGQELFSRARDLAQKISNNAPLAIKYSLEALINGSEMPLDDGLFLEATLFGLCCATEDMREGTRAFLAKRPALFQGR